MEKKNYVAPIMKVRSINMENIMAALSMGFSDDPAHGGGMSKENNFPTEEKETAPINRNYNVWDD